MTAELEQESPGFEDGEEEVVRPHTFVDRGVEALAALTLVVITALLLVNALGRYLFSAPLLWAEEVATSLVVWLTMFGMFITARRRELIRVRSFIVKLSPRAQEGINVVTDLVAAVSLAYLTWYSAAYVQTFGGDKTLFLGMPRGLFTVAIPIGAAVLLLLVLIDMLHRFRGGKSA